MTDSGTNRIIMPDQAWLALFNIVCAKLPPYLMTCMGDYPHLVVTNCDQDKLRQFPPVEIMLDSVAYEIPLQRVFQQLDESVC